MRKLLTLFTALLFVGSMWAGDVSGTINFGNASGSTNVNAASINGDDSQGNTWTITTAGTTSFTPNAAYAQIGSGNKPATSITFTATLPAEKTIKAFSAKFGGFNGTAGTVTLKVGSTSVGTGSLNASTDVTVNATNTTTSGTVLTVTVTGISKGVKAYYISYTYDDGGDPDPVLQSVAISGTPTTTTYEENNLFDVTGLIVTGTYDVGEPAVISDGITWKARTNSTSDDEVALENYHLTAGQTSLQVQATVSAIASEWYTVNGLTVNEHVITPGSYDIALSNTFFGCSTGNIAQEQSAKKNDVTFVAGCISTAQNKTYYDAGHVRFYNESYLHISAPEGYVIDTIIFTAGGTWNNDGISANTGTYDASNKKWIGSANEVDFSFTAQCRISSVHVHYDIAKSTLILSTNVLDFGSVVKDVSVAAQTFTLSGENLEDAHAVTLVAPSGFTVSPTSITPSSGSISAQTITVTPITSAVGTFDGNLTISSDDLDADSIVALTLTVTAAVVNVTSVELDKTSISIEEGETETLTATVLPVDATNKAVTWESSDEDIATVDDGVVTAVAKGSATITCKSVADPTKLATCEVTVTGPDVVLDFTTNGVWSFPTSKTTDEDTFTNGDYSVTAGGGYYFVTADNCLLVGKQNAYLTLPIFTDKAISKIITLAETTGSKDVVFNIYQGATEVSTEVTSCKVDQTFNISPKKVNTEHTLKIKSEHNARFSKILIYYGEPDPIYAVNCAAAENGSVSADKASACAGETVTLTLTPDAGYKVASVIVNGGDPLAVTENQATFEMPAAIANVVATFSVATAIDNTEVEGKAVKVLRNGILYIEKGGKQYNVMGQLIK